MGPKAYYVFYIEEGPHSVETTEIYSHTFFTQISWNQRVY